MFNRFVASDECEEEMHKQERERTKVEGGEVSHKWAKQVEEEHKWWNGTKYNDLEAMVHALSLPLDLSRTRTHIFFRVFKFDPHARRIRAGSRPLCIARCGVFKIDDVIKDIMVLSPKLGPDRNKAKSALAAMVESAPWGQVNILVATWNHVGDKDGSGSVSYGKHALRFPPRRIMFSLVFCRIQCHSLRIRSGVRRTTRIGERESTAVDHHRRD